MKKIILLELILLFLGTTFQGDGPPTAWYLLPMPRADLIIADIDMLDSLTGCLVAYKYPNEDSSFIYKTTNGGNNWELKFQTEGRYERIQFPDSLSGYTVRNSGVGSMYKTTNAGENWFFLNQNLTPISDIFYVNKDTGWCCILTEFGGTYKTTNGGLNWLMQLSGSYSIQKLFFINKDTGWAYNYNIMYKTTNGGINWNYLCGFGGVDCFMLNDQIGWILREGENTIYKTTDGGFTWMLQIDPRPTGSAGLDIIILLENKGWIATGLNGIIAIANDSIWGKQIVPQGYNPYYTIDMIDTSVGYAGGIQRLIKTNDGGGVITNVGNINKIVPEKYCLFQNYPNPFNSMTNVKWQMLNSGIVEIAVYNILGEEIANLYKGWKEPGEYKVKFSGNHLPSGVYFYRLTVDNVPVSAKKMVIQK